MAFIIKLSGSGASAEYGVGAKYEDDDSYQFLPDGVLKVIRKSGSVTTYYAPHVWESVQTKDGHEPIPTRRTASTQLPGIR